MQVSDEIIYLDVNGVRFNIEKMSVRLPGVWHQMYLADVTSVDVTRLPYEF
jgi:hypothetical protein